MATQTSPPRSVARRLSLLSIGLLAGVLFAISLVIGVVAEHSTRGQIVTNIKEKVHGVAGAAESSDVTNRELIRLAFRFFRQYFEANMELDESTGVLKSHGYPVNNDFVSVDKFTEDTGGVATVFARKGDDFIRITTSLKKEDGSRAMGTLLNRESPAYKAIQAGQPYSGPTVLFGKPFMTHYEPMRDNTGKINAILFIGYDTSTFQAGIEALADGTRFYESGGTYIIDPRSGPSEAVFVTHPSAKGRKVLEVYPAADKFLASIASAKDGFIADATPVISSKGGSKWAVVEQTQANRWWVVGEVSDQEAMRQHWQGMAVTWGLLAGATLMLGVGLFAMIRRTVSQPLAELANAVEAVASGDLTQPVTTQRQDDIGMLMQKVEGLRQRYLRIMSQVRSAVNSITTASGEIASGNQDLSYRTEQTANNLQETAQRMALLTSTVQQSADSARQANQFAASAAEVAERGGSVVSQVVSTMDDINQSAKQIADIIGVIDGIAFQTNILALNAAVEAARAGEQGRGFAVVAAEVRSLAQRSAEAAKEIKNLIGNSVTKVESGSKLVKDAGDTMGEIVSSVQRVSHIINEITAAADEQSLGISQVNAAIGELDQMTQQNAALVEESAAAADSLNEQAERLARGVQIFKLSNDPQPQPYTGDDDEFDDEPPAPQTVRAAPVHSHVSRQTPSAAALGGAQSFNLDSAIEAHAQWRTKLRAAADKHEHLDAKTIGRDDACALGSWLHGKGEEKHSQKPAFTEVVQRHREFHVAAGKVAQTINRGDYPTAKSMLGGNTEFSRASSEVGGAIMRLRKELQSNVANGKLATPPPRSPPHRPPRRAAGPHGIAARPAPRIQKPLARVPASGEGNWETF